MKKDTGSLPVAREPSSPFRGARHARFHDPSVVYHVLLRCFQGRFLLRPDRRGVLNDIVAGVIGRAQELWPDVRLYAHAWLSNHAHLMLQGPPADLPRFVGFTAREISRRWGARIDWPDRMWQRYESTALVGRESELRAFRYVLSHGAKEHLVASPLQWPGVHCAKDLVRGTPSTGFWFDGTSYGRAVQAQKVSAKPKPVRKRDFRTKYRITLHRPPACRTMSKVAFRDYVARLIRETREQAESARRPTGKRVLGRRGVFAIPRETRSKLPPQPWFEKRRRMIVWGALTEATRIYLKKYWTFQRAFREASRRFCAGEIDVSFPAGAFRPPNFAGV